ncbi:hypothetical protein [Nocardia australiensis]|uniref:hypothetical protein n=1 Tax=Nocardia australiensis TaxID=2887191 RepID=UPI001D13E9AC|nr:hypothetical protein [Nocardia australiensis]
MLPKHQYKLLPQLATPLSVCYLSQNPIRVFDVEAKYCQEQDIVIEYFAMLVGVDFFAQEFGDDRAG